MKKNGTLTRGEKTYNCYNDENGEFIQALDGGELDTHAKNRVAADKAKEQEIDTT